MSVKNIYLKYLLKYLTFLLSTLIFFLKFPLDFLLSWTFFGFGPFILLRHYTFGRFYFGTLFFLDIMSYHPREGGDQNFDY